MCVCVFVVFAVFRGGIGGVQHVLVRGLQSESWHMRLLALKAAEHFSRKGEAAKDSASAKVRSETREQTKAERLCPKNSSVHVDM